MLILWTVEGRECSARFTIEAEARNFCEQLKTRHGAEDIQLLDADGAALEPAPKRVTGIEEYFR